MLPHLHLASFFLGAPGARVAFPWRRSVGSCRRPSHPSMESLSSRARRTSSSVFPCQQYSTTRRLISPGNRRILYAIRNQDLRNGDECGILCTRCLQSSSSGKILSAVATDVLHSFVQARSLRRRGCFFASSRHSSDSQAVRQHTVNVPSDGSNPSLRTSIRREAKAAAVTPNLRASGSIPLLRPIFSGGGMVTRSSLKREIGGSSPSLRTNE